MADNRPFRILICAVQIPFVSGGAENHIESLSKQLKARNFEVDIVKLPLKWYPPRQIINDAIAWRFLDLTESYGLPIDLVIATRFPSYVVQHPRKIAWVLHQHRQVYDLLTSDLTDFKDTPDDDHVRGMIYDLDKRSLLECKKIFANSNNVADRMKKYLNIDSEPLYHPPPLTGQYMCENYGDFILSVGRLEVNKRVDLLLKSLKHAPEPVKAIIVGTGPQQDNLKKLTADLGISSRVQFRGFVADDELLKLYARCGAVFYAPLDEDYGYITLEAFHSRKAVITANDAGGVLEFVEDGVTGYISEADPVVLGQSIKKWFLSDDRAQSMGEKGKERVTRITWDNVIKRLTSNLYEVRK